MMATYTLHKNKGKTKSWLIFFILKRKTSIVALFLFFLIWEIIVRILDIPTYILPVPSGAIFELYRNFKLIAWFTLITTYETISGFLLSIVLGVLLSITIAFNKFLKTTFYPLIVAFQLVPKIALAPLFITWFGFGYFPKIIVVFSLCFFPILLNGILGFLSITTELEHFVTTTGAGKIRQFFKIRLFNALPQIFVGIRWAAVNATVGATIGEWIGGDSGLGYYMQIASGNLQMNLAFAIIFVLAALGMGIYLVVLLFEHFAISWHETKRHEI